MKRSCRGRRFEARIDSDLYQGLFWAGYYLGVPEKLVGIFVGLPIGIVETGTAIFAFAETVREQRFLERGLVGCKRDVRESIRPLRPNGYQLNGVRQVKQIDVSVWRLLNS